MVDLVPVPFGVLVTRLFRELEHKRAAFDLPAQRFVQGDPRSDLAISCHGKRAATPLGPAAGPHTQLAQNIVLSWLAGGRVIEFKTVQIKDDLKIARPCIDTETVGFNIEWSQELSLAQSLEEYVKASMLIAMLAASGTVRGLDDTVFDMSVGYDLAGISSPRLRDFMAGLRDATAIIDRLRAEIPAPWRQFRDLPFASRISDTLTLSTFHGCPPEEIERIAAFLLEEVGLDVVIKLNPTLLGAQQLRGILNERLGYRELQVPDSAFANDASWEQVSGFVARLANRAQKLGRGFGVKFSNTLVVHNHKNFFPAAEEQMYLSGPPLHPLAIALVAKFRAAFGDQLPVSFSAGIDDANFADTVALGLRPVTVCTDLLKPGGYRRGYRYIDALRDRMKVLGAPDIDSFVILAHGQGAAALEKLALPVETKAACRTALAENGDLRAAAGEAFERWVSAVRLLNTHAYAAQVANDPRYGKEANALGPKRIDSRLVLFDCYTCDKCVPVCPNNANFSFVVPKGALRAETLTRDAQGWRVTAEPAIAIARAKQFGTFADACNECGNCDMQCPEEGGPYQVKPLFFGSVAAWAAAPDHDGFVVERTAHGMRMQGRFGGRTMVLEAADGQTPGGGRVRFSGDGFDLTLVPADPAATAEGRAEGPVNLAPLHIMAALLQAVTAPKAVNYVNATLECARGRDGEAAAASLPA